jgi:hypothetical protein
MIGIRGRCLALGCLVVGGHVGGFKLWIERCAKLVFWLSIAVTYALHHVQHRSDLLLAADRQSVIRGDVEVEE